MPTFTKSYISLLAVLLLSATGSAYGFTTVVIDPGHGGHDRGGIPGQRIPEKVLALDVAKRVERLLRSAGYRTVMTRRSDVFISLAERVRIANAQRDAIFVSIHFNSASNRDATGIETYYYNSAGGRLAYNIQGNLIRACKTDNRGVKRRGFYVIRHTRIPAVLVECGFLTNGREGRRCLSSSYRQTLATQIARGILDTDIRRPSSPASTTLIAKNTRSGESDSPQVVTHSTSRSAARDETTPDYSSLSERDLRALFLKNR